MDLAALPLLATVAQAAEVLGISASQVRRLIEDRRLAHVRIGPKLMRIPRDSIQQFVTLNTVQPCQDGTPAPASVSSRSAAPITSFGPNTVAAASEARALQISARLKSRSPSSSKRSLAAPAPVIRLRS